MMAGIPEGGFENSGQLEAWLEELPEETRVPFARVIAHRAALRALPFITGYIAGKDQKYERWTLAILRSHAILRATLVYPTEKINAELAGKAANDAASAITHFIQPGGTLITADEEIDAMNCADAAIAAADAASDPDIAAAAASLAAERSAFAAAPKVSANVRRLILSEEDFGDLHKNFETAIMWKAVTADTRELSTSGVLGLNRPIWPAGAPDFWQQSHRALSNVMKVQKIWSVWLEWWQARVTGAPSWGLPPLLEQEVETRIALGDGRKDFWDRDPAVVNAEIAGWVEAAKKTAKPDKSLGQFVVAALTERKRQMSVAEIRAAFDAASYPYLEQSLRSILSYYTERGLIDRVSKGVYALPKTTETDEPQEADFAQRPAAHQFEIDDGKIVAKPLLSRRPADALAQAMHDEISRKVREAKNRLESTQAPRHMLDAMERLGASLAQGLQGLNPGMLLMQSRTIESIASAYATPELRNEVAGDAIILVADLAESLTDFRALFPEILELETARLAQQIAADNSNAVLNAAKEIAQSAAESELSDESVEQAFAEIFAEIAESERIARDARSDLVIAEANRQRSNQIASAALDVRNFSARVVKGGKEFTKKAAKDAGKRIYDGAMSGLEKSSEAATIAAFTVLAAKLAGPLFAMAMFALSFKPLAKKAKEIADDAKKDDDPTIEV